MAFVMNLLNDIKPYRKELIITAILYAVSVIASLFMPYIMSSIINIGIKNGDFPYIGKLSGIMVALAAVSAVSSIFTKKLNSRIACGYTCGLRKRVFNKVNSLSVEEFSSLGTAGMITRTTEDIWVFQEVAISVVYAIVCVPILFFGGFILTMLEDAMLSYILLAVTPVVILFTVLVAGKMTGMWDKSNKYIDIQNKVVRERLNGIRVIRAFKKENYEHERMAKATKEMAVNIIRANTLSGVIEPFAILLFNLATVVIVLVGAKRISAGSAITAGAVIACVQYVTLMMSSVLTLSFLFVFFPRIKVSAKRINEILDLKGIKPSKEPPIELEGNLELKKVNFSYPKSEQLALKNIDFSVNEGEIVGVIGGTGSGKTTLMRVLLRFYEAEGSIKLGNRLYCELSNETIRKNISIALQKSMIFGGTVRDNLLMGKPDATDEEIVKALTVAQIWDFIKEQGGLDFVLKESGNNLSGGQKQRINLARAIIKPSSIYIFDDSFSNLDFLTESKLRRALSTYLKGKTQIIITQRAASAMHCDKVFVMDKGEIIGEGKHRELLKSCVLYREIYKSQLGEEGLND